MNVLRCLTILALTFATATSAHAQPLVAQPPRAGDRAGVARLAAIVQRKLRLTDDQASRLQTTTRRFASDREQLLAQERTARRALRAQIAAGDGADQTALGRQLDELLRLQQKRVQIVADEQRELAAFLTPMQRAEFLGMQERAFRAAQQIRQQRGGGAGARRQPQP